MNSFVINKSNIVVLALLFANFRKVEINNDKSKINLDDEESHISLKMTSS